MSFYGFKLQIHLKMTLILCLGGGKKWNGIEEKKKIYIYIYIYFKNILFFPLFESLSRRAWKEMERPFFCLKV